MTNELKRPFQRPLGIHLRPKSHAGPIGAVSVRRESPKATLVAPADSSQELIYKEEIPIISFAEQSRELEVYLKDSTSPDGRVARQIRRLRYEIKFASNNSGVKTGYWVTLAYHPYSSGKIAHAVLKGRYKTQEKKPDQTVPTFDSEEHVVRWLDAQPYEWWEQDKKITAGIWNFEQFEVGKQHNQLKNAKICIGVCENVEAYRERLWSNPSIQDAIRKTHKDSFRISYGGAKLGAVVKLKNETINDSYSVMDIAIKQSLAGAHRNNDQLLGQPVCQKVVEIYRGLLNAVNRQKDVILTNTENL